MDKKPIWEVDNNHVMRMNHRARVLIQTKLQFLVERKRNLCLKAAKPRQVVHIVKICRINWTKIALMSLQAACQTRALLKLL